MFMVIFVSRSILMLKRDRQNLIESKVKEKGSILISNLTGLFDCSPETIRRDLIELENEGRLKRTFGGAYLADKHIKGVPIALRSTMLTEEKQHMAMLALRAIQDSDIIFLDPSSTCVELAKAIVDSQKTVTIITNSITIATLVSSVHNPSIRLISLGGEFRKKTAAFSGPITLHAIKNFTTTKAFISCPFVSIDFGLTDNDIDSAYIRKAMIEHAKQTILLMDHTKFDETSDVVIKDLSCAHVIITDKEVPTRWKQSCSQQNIKIFY